MKNNVSDLLDEINKCHQFAGGNAYTRDVLSRCHREIIRLRACENMLILCGEIGGIGDGEEPATYLRRLLDSHIYLEAALRTIIEMAAFADSLSINDIAEIARAALAKEEEK